MTAKSLIGLRKVGTELVNTSGDEGQSGHLGKGTIKEALKVKKTPLDSKRLTKV
jgi:hypothetical protein